MLQNYFYLPFIHRKQKDNVHACPVVCGSEVANGCKVDTAPFRNLLASVWGIYRYVSHYNNKGITFVAKHPFDRDSLFVQISMDITYSTYIGEINVTKIRYITR